MSANIGGKNNKKIKDTNNNRHRSRRDTSNNYTLRSIIQNVSKDIKQVTTNIKKSHFIDQNLMVTPKADIKSIVTISKFKLTVHLKL